MNNLTNPVNVSEEKLQENNDLTSNNSSKSILQMLHELAIYHKVWV